MSRRARRSSAGGADGAGSAGFALALSTGAPLPRKVAGPSGERFKGKPKVKTLTPKMGKNMVKNLTKDFVKLKIQKFDRVAYRAAYDKVYFKRTVKCPNCGELKIRHMLKRHMRTVKCKRVKTLTENT